MCELGFLHLSLYRLCSVVRYTRMKRWWFPLSPNTISLNKLCSKTEKNWRTLGASRRHKEAWVESISLERVVHWDDSYGHEFGCSGASFREDLLPMALQTRCLFCFCLFCSIIMPNWRRSGDAAGVRSSEQKQKGNIQGELASPSPAKHLFIPRELEFDHWSEWVDRPLCIWDTGYGISTSILWRYPRTDRTMGKYVYMGLQTIQAESKFIQEDQSIWAVPKLRSKPESFGVRIRIKQILHQGQGKEDMKYSVFIRLQPCAWTQTWFLLKYC